MVIIAMTGYQMPTDDANTLAQIDALIDKTRANIAALDDTIRQIRDLSGGSDHPLQQPPTATRDMLSRVATSLEDGVERPVQRPLNTLETRAEILAARRRAHIRGSPSKIDTDPELRAFIIARVGTHTFTQIRDEMRSHFPTDRQTSLSAMSRWWTREGKHLTAHSQVPR